MEKLYIPKIRALDLRVDAIPTLHEGMSMILHAIGTKVQGRRVVSLRRINVHGNFASENSGAVNFGFGGKRTKPRVQG